MYQFELTESLVPPQDDDIIEETTVGELLRRTAAQDPTAPALVEVDMEGRTGRTWSYGELLADSERLALALSSRFAPGERITVWAPNTPEWLLMEYACALAGVTLVTANPAYQPQELRYVLEQSGSAALFSVESYRGNPMAVIAKEACAGLDAVREIVDLDDHSALYRQGERAPALPEVTPDDATQIQYTSGTTGFPKGAVLHHRGLTNNARLVFKRGRVRQGSTWINFMPMFHTSGCGIATLGCLQTASRMLIVKVFEPAAILRLIESEGANALVGVPTMLVAMLEALEQEPRDVSSLRMAISGGSMVAPELVRRVRDAFGCDFETVYGQTEVSPVVTQHHHDDALDDICNTVGQPMPQTGISIRGVEDNTVVPIDTVGEICVQGYCNMIEYNANPEATAETIDADGWLHTGDLGAMDARGYVRVTGRVKEMIIRGGENLFPAEIENVLLEHPAVAEVAVVGLPDDRWGEIVACFLRPEAGQKVDPMELRGYCRQHLAPQKTPALWFNVDEFPLTGSGKIQKFALRDAFLAGDHEPL
ncbi:MAG: AMP-binding protein [Alphaproteobacteria bacterium]|jgi:fatty-acyl-CoA synthase|nr:AMP-binding protein [Alphaproteobacteria bacterium]MDP6567266.1 AMP-binding protein [Alphaproteobacteria bacterium]MDP6811696.1 AMP-binding protein [Alphaproteobacteria bacterium]